MCEQPFEAFEGIFSLRRLILCGGLCIFCGMGGDMIEMCPYTFIEYALATYFKEFHEKKYYICQS